MPWTVNNLEIQCNIHLAVSYDVDVLVLGRILACIDLSCRCTSDAMANCRWRAKCKTQDFCAWPLPLTFRQIAIMYLVTLTLSGCNFAWCSFWIYRPNSTFGLETVEYRPYGSRYGVRCASAMDSLRALYPFRPMKDIVRRGSPRPKRFKTKRAS